MGGKRLRGGLLYFRGRKLKKMKSLMLWKRMTWRDWRKRKTRRNLNKSERDTPEMQQLDSR